MVPSGSLSLAVKLMTSGTSSLVELVVSATATGGSLNPATWIFTVALLETAP